MEWAVFIRLCVGLLYLLFFKRLSWNPFGILKTKPWLKETKPRINLVKVHSSVILLNLSLKMHTRRDKVLSHLVEISRRNPCLVSSLVHLNFLEKCEENMSHISQMLYKQKRTLLMYPMTLKLTHIGKLYRCY